VKHRDDAGRCRLRRGTPSSCLQPETA